MAYDPQHHHRRSIRLKGYDYTAPGAYYITIIVQHRERILSQIVGGRVTLFPTGKLVEMVWRRLPVHFPRVTLDAFVIMPDHIHGIIVLSDEPPPHPETPCDRPKGTRPGSLAAIVQSFKSVSARRINQANSTPGRRVWQEDYYEHIVRDGVDMERIRRYIAANPARWHR
jgi:REP element-mobilizing transposase RayT